MTMRAYPRYKDSGVEWLGEVPEHWRAERLKHVAHVFPSNVDKHSHDDETPVRLCNYTDVYYNDVITDDLDLMQATATEAEIEKFRLRAGDTIITKDSETADDIAVPAFVPEDLPGVVCGYHLSMIRPHGEIMGAYIKRLFDSSFIQACVEVRANGLTRVGLGQYALDNLEIPLPPLPEQAAIAAFLDRETAKIDALVAEQRRLIELLTEKRRAVISHAVTKGLNPDAPMKHSGIDWLGEVPGHWRFVPLKVAVEYQEGPGIMAADFQDHGVPLMRLSGAQGRWATLEGCNYLDPDLVAKRWSHFRLEAGDLVISGSASMGTVTEVGPEAAGAVPYTGLIRMKPRVGKSDRDYVRSFVVSAVFAIQIDQLKAGATIQHFGPTHLRQVQMPLPPLAEQVDIAARIAHEQERFDSLIGEAQMSMNFLQERRTALISAAVTGKVDVRGSVPATPEEVGV